MSRKRKKKIDLDQSSGFGQSLGKILGENPFDDLPTHLPRTTASGSEAHAENRASPWLISMTISRKGRGGKTVTECLGLMPANSAEKRSLATMLSKKLGTRVFWSEELLCVQGDMRDRLRLIFQAEGHSIRP